ncbi:hypothetical protein [Mycolicibacterium fortuitum]|uniref:Uncharacterized protein n=2 Tax=Mycolicibacterium fortuitum TaxID=1766 RepID=A0AAE4VH86_MYCFO|nr:hypothetical protein [Mycolicibacterium fortuitum]AMD56590.1 hypothetical protein ATO49_20805 [Mycolicibacterium fortuitum subsp. fortuitum DSM 46621 = ATCC 6841 = JCM 6387]EJZ10276.1 hypothetical protein MFORT_20870 [Mycolicibacterium fortuitum subsp. fortuitum DSM 46621 = ATCC 6841 = JCM 6387]MBP3086434.1 hypothetical protein [Mycolicibacterium fortuitum]MCA4752460.1 hypothetical protein [Mycolicibacterium fortuitum]MCV7142723.1 hypothetical protein [Mycolicibacterium fortuitum]
MSALGSAKENNQRNLKLVTAGVGAIGGLATAVLGVAMGGGLAGAQQRVEPPAITTGQTVTETTAPSAPETSEASPTVSATTPSGFATPH